MIIGGVEIKGAVLAPLAGYTDAGFRAVCSLCGAGAVYTEMVSAKGLIYESEKTKDLLYSTKYENVSCSQIFGNDPYFIKAACEHEIMDKFALIDINMGCPVPKIVKNGEGSALLNNPALAESVVKAAVSSGRRITVKCRTGFSSPVEAVDIPVIAIGVIRDRESALHALEYTGAAGVAVGRGALGNPFVFARIAGDEPPMTVKQAIDMHMDILLEIYPEHKVVNDMKKHFAFYTKGMRKGKELKMKAFSAHSIKQLKEIAENL